MNCQDCQELLSAYTDRALHTDEQTAVAHHLQGCAVCQAEVQAIISLKSNLRAQTMPRLPREVIAAIESETIFKSSPWQSLWRWGLPTLTLAAALGAWMVMRAHHVTTPGLPPTMPVALNMPSMPDKETLLAMHRSSPSVDDLQ